jgi:hypothetical protein
MIHRLAGPRRRVQPTQEDAGATPARWPNFFIVGVGKAATTSLCDYVGQHPDVFVSPVKEPHFFSRADPRLTPAVRDESEYLRLFEGARHERVLVDASVSYFWDPPSAELIKRAVPDAKALVALRAPAARAYSHYWHAVRYGAEPRSFLTALEDELAGRRPVHNGRRVEPYIRRGRYLEGLRRFRSVFSEDLLVVLLDDIAAHPRGEIRRVFRFLELDLEPAETIDLRSSNEFALPRNRLAARVLNSPSLRRLARGIVAGRFRGRAERALLSSSARPAPMDAEAERLLAAAYADERDELERFLGRPLPW